MVKLQRLAIVLLSVLLIVSTATPALAADTVQVQFQNKTGTAVRITLTGPATVYLTLETGKTKADLEVGTYRFSYDACGKTNTGSFKVRSNGNTLTLPKCAGGSNGKNSTVQLTIQNKTDGTLYYTFTGPHTYYITVPAHSKVKTEMIAGKYEWQMTGTACGGYNEQTGKLQVKGNRTWTWVCG